MRPFIMYATTRKLCSVKCPNIMFAQTFVIAQYILIYYPTNPTLKNNKLSDSYAEKKL